MPVTIGQKYTKLTPIYELPERTKSRGKIYHQEFHYDDNIVTEINEVTNDDRKR